MSTNHPVKTPANSIKQDELVEEAKAPFQFVLKANRPFTYFLAMLVFVELADSLWESILLIAPRDEPLATRIFGFYWASAIILPVVCLLSFDWYSASIQKPKGRWQMAKSWIVAVMTTVVYSAAIVTIASFVKVGTSNLDELAEKSVVDTLKVIIGAIIAVLVILAFDWWRRNRYKGGDPVVDAVTSQVRGPFLTSLVVAIAVGVWAFLAPTIHRIDDLKRERDILDLQKRVGSLEQRLRVEGGKP